MTNQKDLIIELIKTKDYKKVEIEISRITLELIDKFEKKLINQSDIYNQLLPIYDYIWPLSHDINFSDDLWDIFLELDYFKSYGKMDTSILKTAASEIYLLK